jgi:hypothetical protein
MSISSYFGQKRTVAMANHSRFSLCEEKNLKRSYYAVDIPEISMYGERQS